MDGRHVDPVCYIPLEQGASVNGLFSLQGSNPGLLVFFGGGKYLLTPGIEPGTVNPYGTVFAKYTKRISGIKV